jgi:hypothetical protein
MTIVSFFLSALLCLSCLSITLTQQGALQIVALVLMSCSFWLCIGILTHWIMVAIETLVDYYKRR